MQARRSPVCPYCLVALIGTTFLLVLPELADVSTPVGNASLLLFWLPTACALLRQGLLRISRFASP
jgi:hypothetical protein